MPWAKATVVRAKPPGGRGKGALNPKNRTKYRSLDKIAADPRVQEIWDEGEDGIWVALVRGYNWDGVSCVHEWKVKDVIEAFKLVSEGETY